MGAFQGIAAGIGEGGEQVATGENAAYNQILNTQALQHQWGQQNQEMDLRRQQVQQQYGLAQQQQEMYRQGMLNQGWKDMGATIDPATQKYTRRFSNLFTGETKQMPIEGTPPDSPAGMMAAYQYYKGAKDDKGNPAFNDDIALQLAFKGAQPYREGPAFQLQAFRDDANRLAASGLSKFTGPDGKLMDISTPAGIQQYAEKMMEANRPGYFGKYAPGSDFSLLGGASGGGQTAIDMYAKGINDGTVMLTNVPAAIRGTVLDRYSQLYGNDITAQVPEAAKATLTTRRDSIQQAYNLIQRVQQNSDLLSSLPRASIIDLAKSPSTISSWLGRLGMNTLHSNDNKLDQNGAPIPGTDTRSRAQQLAADMRSMSEAINVIRAPLGGQGFKGKDAWEALQSQVVQATGSPEVNAATLANTSALLKSLLDSTNSFLGARQQGGAGNNDQYLNQLIATMEASRANASKPK